MKLIGSKTEEEFRNSLVNYLNQGDKDDSLYKVLKSTFSESKTAYILSWTPEQREDIYVILVNIDKVAIIEISRINRMEKPIIEIFSLKDYKKRLSKIFQIKLAVAIDLAKMNIEDSNKNEEGEGE